MIPILYSSITEGTVPSDYGLGALTDCLECYVNEERNGVYELTMIYAAQGIHASDIQVGRFIKAMPNYTDAAQLFRIYKVGKNINGRFEVNAEHVSYLLSGKIIKSGTAVNCASACALLQAQAGNFTINTTKTVTANFKITEPSSVRSWFGGKEGSLLDVYGTGEWHYNNFICSLKLHRGEDRHVTIRYGKNLTELKQETNCSNLYTHVLSFYKNDDGVISGNEIATGLTADKKVLVLDASDQFQEPPTVQDLDDYTTAYISSNTASLTVPSSNFTLNFVQSGTLTERVDLCDTVTVYYEALGINATVKCIRVKWDVLGERYIETEFGDPKGNICDTLNKTTAAVESVQKSADGKSRTFLTTPLPPYDVGDLWVYNGTIYVCHEGRTGDYINIVGTTTTAIYDGDTSDTTITIDGQSHTAAQGDVATYNGTLFVWDGSAWRDYIDFVFNDWNLATDYVDNSDLEDSISTATALITGVAGGLVILHDTNEDGAPDEIIITDNNNFNSNTAKLWRWNKNGLGYSHSGYAGPYETAISIDENGNGQINASLITTGTLNASLVNIQNLTATMFSGQTIVLGGNEDAKLEVQDSSYPPNTLIRVNGNGLECFGEEVGGVIPSVVFDKHGVTGYSDSSDKDNTAIFWTHEDEFHMKNAVVKNEAAFGEKIRFVPMNTGTNNGIAIVAVV